jgi:hypothetical protein
MRQARHLGLLVFGEGLVPPDNTDLGFFPYASLQASPRLECWDSV